MALGSVRPETGRDERSTVVQPPVGRGPWRAARRRGRRLPFLSVGGLLVLVCVLGFSYGAVRLGERVSVLAAARPVVGRTAVVPLLPGTLLTRSLIGDAAFPPAGKVVASLAVKPGQYPQGLAAGSHVAVFVSAANATGGTQTSTGAGTTTTRLSAVVLGVDPRGDGQGATVVTLLLDASDAGRLAGAGGVVLMQTAPGGD